MGQAENLRSIVEDGIKVSGSTVTNGLQVRETWTPLAIVDNNVGNAKTFTVPSNREYEIISILLTITTTATVGNRVPAVDIASGSNDIVKLYGGFVIPASTSNKSILFGRGLIKETAYGIGGVVATAILPSGIILPSGYVFKVSDAGAIDSADTLKVRILLRERVV